MIKFGLTGGIASGKSTVNKTLQSLGIPLVDADIVARKVVEPGTVGLKQIVQNFGDEYLLSDGTLNRPKLGELVFGNKIMRALLDGIMFPLIVEETDRQFKAMKDAGHEIVGYDAALICEMGRADEFRPLIVVHCSIENQLQRLMSRNNLTKDEAMARIEAQMPASKRIKMADYTINTDGSIEDSRQQSKKIVFSLRQNLGRFCFNCGREYHPNDLAVMCEGCGYDNPR